MPDPILATANNTLPADAIKTPYLISLKLGNQKQNFITIDKPDYGASVCFVKGVFTEKSVEDIVTNYRTILKDTPKENVVEIVFPLDKVNFLRSLIFKSK